MPTANVHVYKTKTNENPPDPIIPIIHISFITNTECNLEILWFLRVKNWAMGVLTLYDWYFL